MEAEAIDTSRDPAIPYALRDDIGERLESFCKHHGSQLGHRLWNEWLQGVVISVAELIDADLFVWIADEDGLDPVFNGPRTDRLAEGYRQPIKTGRNEGTVSMVYERGQFFAEPRVGEESGPDKVIDRLLGIETRSLMASPLYFGSGLRGVVSAIRFTFAGQSSAVEPEPFSVDDVEHFECMVSVLGRLMDEVLVSRALSLR